MKARVNEECISCEVCVEMCPEVFEMGDEYAQVKIDPIPEGHAESVREAADACPTSAIEVEE